MPKISRTPVSECIANHLGRHHCNHAAQSTWVASPPSDIPPAVFDPLAPPSPAAQCSANITAMRRIHMRSRHQVDQQAPTRPLRTQARQARAEQHIHSRSRAESAQHTAPHRPPRSQARHDSRLRPLDRQTHSMHSAATRPQRSRRTQNTAQERVLGCADRRGPERGSQCDQAHAGTLCRFKVKSEEGLNVRVGETVGASWFTAGQWVDVRGISRGMGFAGVSATTTHEYL
jgi:hypothetical protein